MNLTIVVFSTVLQSLNSAQDEVSIESIVQAIIQETQTSELGEKVMTRADRLKQEGEEIGEKRGEKRGLEKGTIIGEIRFAQRMLKKPQSSKEELFKETTETLNTMLSQLEQKLQ